MLELFIYMLVSIVSLYILIKSADYLILSASTLGQRANINKLVIGLTLVAIGTSLPELFTAIYAIFTSSNPSSFVFGTVIGSNIANILLVFGILLVFTNKFKSNLKKFDIYFLILSTILAVGIILNSQINRFTGLLFFMLFIFYIYKTIKLNKVKNSTSDIEKELEDIEDEKISKRSTYFVSFIFFLSLVGLNISARGVVLGIENIGLILLIPIEYLTLTTLAFATSLPEVIVTISSIRKKNYDLGIGNLVGSNISNIFLIIGSSALIKPLFFTSQIYYFSLVFLIISTIAFLIIINKKNIKKRDGIILLILYFIYVIFTFI